MQVSGNQVERTLHAERRLRPPSTAVGPGRRLIGNHALHRDAHGGCGIGAREAVTGRDRHGGCREEKIRAQVGHNMHAQAQQGPIVLDGGLHVHGVTAAMKGELVFPALFDGERLPDQRVCHPL